VQAEGVGCYDVVKQCAFPMRIGVLRRMDYGNGVVSWFLACVQSRWVLGTM
jgi:hypothetical protein